jgi:hypothetical protein
LAIAFEAKRIERECLLKAQVLEATVVSLELNTRLASPNSKFQLSENFWCAPLA